MAGKHHSFPRFVMSIPRRYDHPSGNPRLGPESAADLDVIGDHIEKWWGASPEVFHEIHSEYVHLDLHIVPASPTRPYHTVVTSGMSDRPMKAPKDCEADCHCELLIALPPEWPLEKEAFDDERVWWPFRQLKESARFPHVYDTRLWYGHTLANEDPPQPYADDTEFCAGVLSLPLLCPDEARTLTIRKDKVVHFFSFIPLYLNELMFARANGSKALFAKLDGQGVTELIRKGRPVSC
jgi:hypothetical protein